MKKFLSVILTFFCISITSTAAIGDWKIYMAYSEPQNIQETGDYLFVQASNSLYLYNKNDQSIQTFDKTTGMNDVVVTHISWNQSVRRLIVVYDNSNIDIMDMQGNITNVPDLYNKSMTEDKTVNSIINNGKYAYIATNFGGIKLNVAATEISESYLLNDKIKRFAISGGNIYALSTQNKAITAPLSTNLQDKSNWTPITSYPSGLFEEDKSAYNNNIELVKTLQPGGPKSNYFGFMKFKDGILYTCSGTFWDNNVKANIQLLKDDKWNIYKDDYIPEITGQRYWDMMCLDVYENKLAAGTRNGLYIFEDGILKNFYNNKNSILESNANDGNKDYVLVTGLSYDKNGNLWVFNSAAHSQSIIEYKTDGTFVSHKQEKLIYVINPSTGSKRSAIKMVSPFIDDNNNLWFTNSYWIHPATYRYDIDNNDLYDFNSFYNQDGTEINSVNAVNCIKEDKANNEFIVGTNSGLIFLPKENINNPEKGYIQFKVPRNDGTNLADYLLAYTEITCVAIDGGGRKWIGTNGAGVYVISQDKLTQIEHFKSDNSILLSDNILSIAINDTSGEVFIGTDKGLCSYQSSVTLPNEEMDEDNVWAYPNPVTPDYTGTITITGLSLNTDVKITASNGTLVAQGRSIGGSFQWDGNDLKGKRVASGVYMVNTATKDGEKGIVCKIAVIN